MRRVVVAVAACLSVLLSSLSQSGNAAGSTRSPRKPLPLDTRPNATPSGPSPDAKFFGGA